MAISTTCSGCRKTLRCRDELAGRRIRCPECATVNEVLRPDALADLPLEEMAGDEEEPLQELPSPRSGRPASANLMKQVLGAFRGEFERPRVSMAYLAALLFVAAFSVLLVLTYIGLVIAAAYGVYWHAVTHTSWLQFRGGIGGRGRALI